MSVAFNSPLTSANANGAFVSRTQDTSMVGKLDNQNTTDSTSTSSGAIHTAGGLGVEKKAHINQVYVDSLSGDKALITSPTREVIESAVTAAELATLEGIESNVQAQLDLKANDSEVVHLNGDETINGKKTFNENATFQQDMVIQGNLTVNGTSTTINTATLDVEDTNITINKTGNDATAEGAGLTVDRTGTKGSFVYDSSLASKFKAGNLGSESEVITASTVQAISGDKSFNNIQLNAYVQLGETNDSVSTGADQTLSTPTSSLRLSNASLSSIAGLADALSGKIVILTNKTGAGLIIRNESSAALAAERILTGSNSDLTVDNNASVWVSYSSASSRWYVIGGSGSGAVQKQEVPSGVVNGVNTTFALSFTPNSSDSVSVYVNGVVREKSKWSIIGSNLVFTSGEAPKAGQGVYVIYSTGASGGGGGSSLTQEVEYFTLSSTDISNKKVTLLAVPASATKVMVDVIGGTAQEYSVDFIVTGSDVDWSGLGLDGLLSAGNKLRINYFS